MSIEHDEVKRIVVDQLDQAGYEVKTHFYVKGKYRDTIIPICIMAEDKSPCLAIRIRLRDQNRQKPSEKPSKRVQAWEKITGNQVITIWSRSDAEKVTKIVNNVFST